MKIGLISGSLRKASHNTALLRALEKMIPKEHEVIWIRIDNLAFYNEDLDIDPPEEVKNLRELVRSLDLLLIATPEYNHHTTGVLKNAIDWLSRPFMHSSIVGKKVVLMGAGSSRTGATRVLMLLREIFFTMGANLFRHSEINIPRSFEVFDEDGTIKYEPTKAYLQELLSIILLWASEKENA